MFRKNLFQSLFSHPKVIKNIFFIYKILARKLKSEIIEIHHNEDCGNFVKDYHQVIVGNGLYDFYYPHIQHLVNPKLHKKLWEDRSAYSWEMLQMLGMEICYLCASEYY